MACRPTTCSGARSALASEHGRWRRVAVYDEGDVLRADAAESPGFVDWAVAAEPGLWRFGRLVTGDLHTTAQALEQVLDAMYWHWDDLAGASGRVDLDLRARQQLVRALGDGRRDPIRDSLGGSPGGSLGGSLGASLRGDDRGSAVRPSGDAPAHERDEIWRVYTQLDLEHRVAVVLRYDERRAPVDIADVLDSDPEDAEQILTDFAIAASSAVAARGGDGSVGPLLREAFDARVPASSAGHSVAERIQTTARRRRRRYGAVGAMAAIALLVPMAWIASPPQPEHAPPGVLMAETENMRWESYGGVEVQVPRSWGYGDLTQWCAPADSPGHVDGPSVDRAFVDRPDFGATHCSASPSTGNHGRDRPTYAAGLLLRPAGQGPRLSGGDVARDATIFRRTVGEVELTVVDVDPGLARQILSSAAVISGRDRRGCPARTGIPQLGRHSTGDGGGVDGMGGAVTATICHYETRPWGRPTLVFSERLDRPGAAEDLRQRIRAAPPLDPVPPTRHAPGCEETEAMLVSLHGFGTAEAWVHYDGCVPHGTDDGRRPRALTEGVLGPVLDEPWRGPAVDGVLWRGHR